MDTYYEGFLLSDDKNLLQTDRVYELLHKTYWAKTRAKDVVEKSIENSLCFGVYEDGLQIGFARAVTDHAVLFYLCDVVIDENYRGQGLGKALMKFVSEHAELSDLSGWLATKDAHGLYEKFGYRKDPGHTMLRSEVVIE